MTLENESKKATDLFRLNNIIANPENFQSMILKIQIAAKLIETINCQSIRNKFSAE